MFDGLHILSNTTKHDQTHTNTIKRHQTRCPNGNLMFGHQTMFDGHGFVANIFRLSRPLNEHGDPRIFFQVFARNSLIKYIFEEEKKFASGARFFFGK